MARAVRTKQIVHIPDIRKQSLLDESIRAVLVKYGLRTVLAVPLLQEKAVLGVIAIHRQEVRPFSDRQIELIKNFAHQAVIALENVRLLNELRESLQQQTATSEVLSVISNSPGNLQPVFAAALSNATRLCGATFGALYLREGDAFRIAAHHNAPAAFIEERRRSPLIPPIAGSGLGRMVATKQAAQIADVQAEPVYHSDPVRAAFLKAAGARTLIKSRCSKKTS
jgi:hypothetical protein